MLAVLRLFQRERALIHIPGNLCADASPGDAPADAARQLGVFFKHEGGAFGQAAQLGVPGAVEVQRADLARQRAM